MKEIRSTTKPDGTRRLTIEVPPDEKLVVIKVGHHYCLGYPFEEDVYPSHVLEEVHQVTWCPIEQRWRHD